MEGGKERKKKYVNANLLLLLPGTAWLLSQEGVDVHATLPISMGTPLHLAVHNGHLEVVRLLLSAGANPQAKALIWLKTEMFWCPNAPPYYEIASSDRNKHFNMHQQLVIPTDLARGNKEIIELLLLASNKFILPRPPPPPPPPSKSPPPPPPPPPSSSAPPSLCTGDKRKLEEEEEEKGLWVMVEKLPKIEEEEKKKEEDKGEEEEDKLRVVVEKIEELSAKEEGTEEKTAEEEEVKEEEEEEEEEERTRTWT